jgi:hypothetical protein
LLEGWTWQCLMIESGAWQAPGLVKSQSLPGK